MTVKVFDGRFAGKVMVVTGAAQGIGRATAERAAAEGAAVVLADRSPLVKDVAEDIVAEVKKAGIPVDSIVRHGDPVDLLNDIVTERQAIQVVVGRTGDTRVKRALFGSIPGHLTRTATVPVTVVP